MSKLVISETLEAATIEIGVTNLQVNNLSEIELWVGSVNEFQGYLNIPFCINLYFGNGGLLSEIPVKRIEILGCVPTEIP